jgi:hypothetical protein
LELRGSAPAAQAGNWCWSAAGTTIAVFHRYSIDQNRFRALAKNTDPDQTCPTTRPTWPRCVERSRSNSSFTWTHTLTGIQE